MIPEVIDGVTVKGFDISFIDGATFTGFERLTRITLPKSMGGLVPGTTGEGENYVVQANIEDFLAQASWNSYYYGVDISNLEEIVVDAANPYYTTEGGVLFNKDKTDLLYYPAAKPGTSYQIPNGVQNISQYAFQGCTGLTSVTIPDSVLNIYDSTFQGCTGLTSVTISDGVEIIGSSAFEGCTGLTSVTIPDSVLNIYDSTFQGCTGLTSVTISDGVEIIGSSAFEGCTGLTSVTIPDSVRDIERSAFQDCTNLEDITLPDTVYNIWDDVFLDTAYYNDPSNWENGCLYIDNWLIKADSSQMTGEYAIREETVGIADNAFKTVQLNQRDDPR